LIKNTRNRILLAAAFGLSAASCAPLSHHADPAIFDDPHPDRKADYTLTVGYQTVAITEKPVQAMTFNGTIPGPLIEATEGEDLTLRVCNTMDVETSVHWHGVLLPNPQDGVPYLTTMPVKPGKCLTYTYPIVHSGTFWYHSHTGLQEQRGLYGPIIFHPKNGEKIKTDTDRILVLSDWTDEKPEEVLRHLKKDDDYYTWMKKAPQTWKGVFENGLPAVKNRIKSLGMVMDLADVAYDSFLVNGQTTHRMSDLKGGDTVRLRIVNSAASSTFDLTSSCGTMTIIAADGTDTQPLPVSRQRIAVAETFDVTVPVPEGQSCEVRATTNGQRQTPGGPLAFASAVLGTGPLAPAPVVEPINPYLQSHDHGHGGHGGHENHARHAMPEPDQKPETAMPDHHDHHAMMDHSKMDHFMHGQPSALVAMAEYEKLRAVEPTTLPEENPWHDITLRMTGQMIGYSWSFADVPFSKAEPIRIKLGENIRLTLQNDTMMAHPFHLHGHFFRVMNGQGEYSPKKHTVNVPPNGSVTIEFAADAFGDWMAHCHILYHAESGMMGVFHYDGFSPAPDLAEARKTGHHHGDDQWFFNGYVGVATHQTDLEINLIKGRHLLELEGEWNNRIDSQKLYAEGRVLYGYKITPAFSLHAGINSEHEDGKPSVSGIICARNTTFLITAQGCARTDGGGEATLGNEHRLTDRLLLEWDAGIEKDPGESVQPIGHVQFRYEFNKTFSGTAGCDGETKGCGAGIRLDW